MGGWVIDRPNIQPLAGGTRDAYPATCSEFLSNHSQTSSSVLYGMNSRLHSLYHVSGEIKIVYLLSQVRLSLTLQYHLKNRARVRQKLQLQPNRTGKPIRSKSGSQVVLAWCSHKAQLRSSSPRILTYESFAETRILSYQHHQRSRPPSARHCLCL